MANGKIIKHEPVEMLVNQGESTAFDGTYITESSDAEHLSVPNIFGIRLARCGNVVQLRFFLKIRNKTTGTLKSNFLYPIAETSIWPMMPCRTPIWGVSQSGSSNEGDTGTPLGAAYISSTSGQIGIAFSSLKLASGAEKDIQFSICYLENVGHVVY